MLRDVGSGPQVVVCSTCGSGDVCQDAEGRRGGALLAHALRAVREASPAYAGVGLHDMPCLFACARHCAVHIRAGGKIGYVLGGFSPDEEAARAILDYAVLHAASAEGTVAYGQWPEGVKNHFIARTPPEGYVAQ